MKMQQTKIENSVGLEPARSTPVLIVTGEVSGDQAVAEVIRALKDLKPDVHCFGMAGSKCRAAGMELIVDAEQAASVMGLTELVGSLGSIVNAYRSLIQAIDTYKPKVAVLVDFPDFNLFLAKRLKKRGIKVVYFITPQLWAWRKGRMKLMKQYVSKVCPIFPFEESVYHRAGVDAEYVGHPFLDRETLPDIRKNFLESLNLRADSPTVALLPGSRHAEVKSLLQPMVEALAILRQARPGLQAILPVAPTLSEAWIREQLPPNSEIVLTQGQAREVLASADVGIVASGTATVEAALQELPFVIVYKLSSLSYRIAKTLVRGVRFIGMPNLIAGKKVLEELIQSEVCPRRIAEEVERLLGDSGRRESIKADLRIVRERMARGLDEGVSTGQRVAKAVVSCLEEGSRGKRKLR